MLVLSVKKNGYVQLGADITVRVVASDGPVKLGFEAPSDIKILRDTLWERQEREKQKKAALSDQFNSTEDN